MIEERLEEVMESLEAVRPMKSISEDGGEPEVGPEPEPET